MRKNLVKTRKVSQSVQDVLMEYHGLSGLKAINISYSFRGWEVQDQSTGKCDV
jgi:hypothetical protein